MKDNADISIYVSVSVIYYNLYYTCVFIHLLSH